MTQILICHGAKLANNIMINGKLRGNTVKRAAVMAINGSTGWVTNSSQSCETSNTSYALGSVIKNVYILASYTKKFVS